MISVVISQPMYFPWPGFLAQMALADVIIWLDDVQFSKGSFTNRVQIKTPSGRKWMTIPVVHKGMDLPIHDLVASKADWRQRNRDMLVQSLRGYYHDQAALAVFDRATGATSLCESLISSAEDMTLAMGLARPKTLRSSDMGLPGRSWQRVLELVKSVNGDRYITGHGALSYLDHDAFEAAGIAVDYMDYQPHPWPQRHGEFTPFVTGLDLIAAVPASDTAGHLNPKTIPWRDFRAQRTSTR